MATQRTKTFFLPEPRVLAHRGYSAACPENMMPAFHKAVEFDPDVLETDVRLTRDGRFVVFHDDTLERTTNGAGPVEQRTLDELRRFDAGFRFTRDNGATFPFRGAGVFIPTLEDLLDAFPDRRFNIELKTKSPAQVESYLSILKRYDALDRVLTASEYGPNIKELRRQCPTMATSFSLYEALWLYFLYKSGFLFKKKSFTADALQIPEYYGTSHVVTPAFVRLMRERGVRVHVWTINRPEDMQRLLDMGVHGIFSDEVAILKNVVREHEARAADDGPDGA